MGDVFAEARALLVQGVEGVFEERGAKVAARGSGSPLLGSLLGRAILFEGGEARGIVAVSADHTFWEAVVPEDLRPLSAELLGDMVGEICNLVLGRLQNKLLRRGIYIASGTPVPHEECHLAPGHGGHTYNAVECFEAASGFVYVRFDFRVSTGFTLEAEEETEPLPTAGEDLLWL
jgi:hypothetical protein